MRHLPTILMALAILALGTFWVTQYVIPKDRVLMAASECQQRTRASWGACLQKAEAEHATSVLIAVGY